MFRLMIIWDLVEKIKVIKLFSHFISKKVIWFQNVNITCSFKIVSSYIFFLYNYLFLWKSVFFAIVPPNLAQWLA